MRLAGLYLAVLLVGWGEASAQEMASPSQPAPTPAAPQADQPSLPRRWFKHVQGLLSGSSHSATPRVQASDAPPPVWPDEAPSAAPPKAQLRPAAALQPPGPPPPEWPPKPPPPEPAPPKPAPEPTPPPVESSAPVSGVPASSVEVRKIGPEAINLGKPLAYEIVVRNAGLVPVLQVHVEDEVPADARFLHAEPPPNVQGNHLTWSLGQLEPGAEEHLNVVIQPGGEGDLQTRATATFATVAALQTRVTVPRLTLTLSGPESPLIGDPVDFLIRVTNTGTGPARDVVLEDTLPPGLHHEQGQHIEAELGNLAPGETREITLRTQAVQTGRHLNRAMAIAQGDLKATAQAAVTIMQPALVLRQTGPTARFLNREAEYTLEVSDPGSAAAANVLVVDSVPEGLEYVSASDDGTYDAATRTVKWPLGSLLPGQHRSLMLRLLTKTPGDLVNQATARGDRGLEAKAEAALHVEGVPALLLEVVDLADPIEVGADMAYEIRVLNQGSSPVSGVEIQATVPDGMLPRFAEGPSASHIEGQQVNFEPVPRMAARADALYRVHVRGQKAGDLRFKVYLKCDQLRSPVYKEESTRVYEDH